MCFILYPLSQGYSIPLSLVSSRNCFKLGFYKQIQISNLEENYYAIRQQQKQQELNSLNTSASSIKYVTNKNYASNKVFLLISHVFISNHEYVWKIRWKHFGSIKLSNYMKVKQTILWLFVSHYELIANQVFVWKINLKYFSLD